MFRGLMVLGKIIDCVHLLHNNQLTFEISHATETEAGKDIVLLYLDEAIY